MRLRFVAGLFLLSFPIFSEEKGIYPLADLSQHDDFRDLAAFGRDVDAVRIVALGESIHTSGGFYDLKVRLIKYLILEKGFRALAFETPIWDAEVTRAFVAGHPDISVNTALSGIFDVWNHTGVRDLLLWLKQWNLHHQEDPVVFFGFDNQQVIKDTNILKTFLNPGILEDQNSLLALNTISKFIGFAHKSMEGNPLDRQKLSIAYSPYFQWMGKELGKLKSRIQNLSQKSDQRFMGLLSQRSLWADFERALAILREDFVDQTRARDQGMADLLTMQMNRLARNQKVIIWAHNFHIEKGRQFPNRDGTNHGPQTMGYFLDAAFGYQYAPFLLLGGRVEINWLSSFSPPRQFGLEGEIESRIEARGYDRAYVHFGRASHLLPSGVPHLWGGSYSDPGSILIHKAQGDIRKACTGAFYLSHSPPRVRVNKSAW